MNQIAFKSMLKHFRNVQSLYERLNLLGQQTGADVTFGFRSQNEPKAITNP